MKKFLNIPTVELRQYPMSNKYGDNLLSYKKLQKFHFKAYFFSTK